MKTERQTIIFIGGQCQNFILEGEWDNQLRLNSCMARNSLPRKTYLARKRNLAWLGKKRKVGKTEKKGKNF